MGFIEDELKAIGKNVASMWGGECISVEKDEHGRYIFHCIEAGELFDTVLSEAELAEYDY